MKEKISIILSLTLMVQVLFGQTAKDSLVVSEWKLGSGYEIVRTSDLNTSPLVYSSNNGIFTFELSRTAGRTILNTEISLSAGNNQSKQHGRRTAFVLNHYSLNGDRDSSQYDINPKFSFLKPEIAIEIMWKIVNRKSILYAGLRLEEQFAYTAMGADVWFFNQTNLRSEIYMPIISSSTKKLTANISSPFLSYLLRQPYTLDPSLPESSYMKAYLKTGSNICSYKQFQSITIKLHYAQIIWQEKLIGVTYKFNWINYANIPNRNLKQYTNSLSINYYI